MSTGQPTGKIKSSVDEQIAKINAGLDEANNFSARLKARLVPVAYFEPRDVSQDKPGPEAICPLLVRLIEIHDRIKNHNKALDETINALQI